MDVERIFYHTDAMIRIHTREGGRPLPKRKAFYRVKELLKKNRLLMIHGLRGVGKTVLTLQLAESLRNEHGDRVVYINSDFIPDVRDAVMSFLSYHGFENIESVDLDLYILLDEVHQFEGWQRLLKTLHDGSKHIHVVATGSSAINLLSSPDLLRRAARIELPPLYFSEYRELLKFKEGKVDRSTKELFVDYLLVGGFPFFTGDREVDYGRILDVVSRIVWQDLGQVYPRVTPLMNRLLRYLSANVPGPLSYQKVSNLLGISRATVERYLSLLVEADLVKRVEPCSLGRPLKPYKYYFATSSIVSALNYIVPPLKEKEKGVLLETYVANLLHPTCYENGDFLWKGKILEVGWKKRKRRKDEVVVSVEGEGIRPWEIEEVVLKGRGLE